jgi:hypothetical protein
LKEKLMFFVAPFALLDHSLWSMHPFQDGNHITSKQKGKQRELRQSRDAGRPGLGSSTSSVTSNADAGSRSSNLLRSSTRLPTYVDYTALNGREAASNDSASLPTDADDKLKKYYSVTSGSIRGRVIARANSTRGWVGASLRAGVRAGILETRFWLRALFVLLLMAILGVSGSSLLGLTLSPFQTYTFCHSARHVHASL